MMRLLSCMTVAYFAFATNFALADVKKIAPLKIGLITPLTGGVATWGKSVRAAIELANSQNEQPAELFF